MKSLIEGVKANKGKIIKRGLLILGGAAGLLLAYNVLKGPSDEEDYTLEMLDVSNDESSEEETTEE